MVHLARFLDGLIPAPVVVVVKYFFITTTPILQSVNIFPAIECAAEPHSAQEVNYEVGTVG